MFADVVFMVLVSFYLLGLSVCVSVDAWRVPLWVNRAVVTQVLAVATPVDAVLSPRCKTLLVGVLHHTCEHIAICCGVFAIQRPFATIFR